MPDLKIFSSDELVDATVKQRQETYFLVTEDFINSFKNKTILTDVFLFIASLSWGAYASSTITINTIPRDESESLVNVIFQLRTLQSVLLVAALIFTILTFWMLYISKRQVKKLKEANIALKKRKPAKAAAKQGATKK